ncbi:MAG: T9SS type A sorting domain-containing protein, partial [Bacteroidota bacterium]
AVRAAALAHEAVDRATGDRIKMWRQTSYTFSAASGDWTGRFLVTVRPGASVASVAPEADVLSKAETRIGEVYPNPASGTGRIEVVLGAEQAVRIAVIDALGREVAVAHDGPLAEGATAVALPVASLAAGTYVVRVTGEGVAETRRLTVTR